MPRSAQRLLGKRPPPFGISPCTLLFLELASPSLCLLQAGIWSQRHVYRAGFSQSPPGGPRGPPGHPEQPCGGRRQQGLQEGGLLPWSALLGTAPHSALVASLCWLLFLGQ